VITGRHLWLRRRNGIFRPNYQRHTEESRVTVVCDVALWIVS